MLHALNFVFTCARLNPHLHDQIFTLPSRNAAIDVVQIGKGRSVLKKMAVACKAMIAKIGEMSSPPIGRITRLNGAITGSTSIEINAVAGLYVPGAIQLNMMWMKIANVNKRNDNKTRSINDVSATGPIVGVTELSVKIMSKVRY